MIVLQTINSQHVEKDKERNDTSMMPVQSLRRLHGDDPITDNEYSWSLLRVNRREQTEREESDRVVDELLADDSFVGRLLDQAITT
jgi:hypothetical protein